MTRDGGGFFKKVVLYDKEGLKKPTPVKSYFENKMGNTFFNMPFFETKRSKETI